MSERKYRQAGYQDHGAGEPRRETGQPALPRRDPTLKPGGRGLGKPTASAFRCKVCGTSRDAAPIASDTVCAHCGADLHTCTHCTSFDTAAPNQCREPAAERVAAKAQRNGCSFFQPRVTKEFAREAETPRDARAAFDALFKL